MAALPQQPAWRAGSLPQGQQPPRSAGPAQAAEVHRLQGMLNALADRKSRGLARASLGWGRGQLDMRPGPGGGTPGRRAGGGLSAAGCGTYKNFVIEGLTGLDLLNRLVQVGRRLAHLAQEVEHGQGQRLRRRPQGCLAVHFRSRGGRPGVTGAWLRGLARLRPPRSPCRRAARSQNRRGGVRWQLQFE